MNHHSIWQRAAEQIYVVMSRDGCTADTQRGLRILDAHIERGIQEQGQFRAAIRESFPDHAVAEGFLDRVVEAALRHEAEEPKHRTARRSGARFPRRPRPLRRRRR